MTEVQCLQIAENFLYSNGIGYLPAGRVGRKEEHRWEAIFPIPETLDPRIAVIDPPDVRVWVDIFGGGVELIYQM